MHITEIDAQAENVNLSTAHIFQVIYLSFLPFLRTTDTSNFYRIVLRIIII